MKRMEKDVARIMDEAVERGDTPCALTLLWRQGEEMLFHASGCADLERNLPVARDTLFRLYSLTKPMTAVAAMTLAQRGDLDFGAPVSEYLEGFCGQRVSTGEGKTMPVARPMQVRDLFSMTSGLCYPGNANPAERETAKLFEAFAQEERAGNQPDTLGVANRIARLPLAFHPGEHWQYGASADVLGAIIQVAAGRPLDEYMNDTLFTPLGMKDTGFFVPEEKQGRLATLYKRRDGILSPCLSKHFGLNSFLVKPNFISGGAGLVSTADDVLRFARMLLAGGELDGERVLSPRSVAWLSHNHLTDAQRGEIRWDSMYGYGYGGLMQVLLEPSLSHSLGVEGEFGWDGWAGAYMSVCPREETILLMLQQRADSGTTGLTRRVRNVVYANLG